MAEPFVSKDGPDGNGVRAEVYVQTGTGTIKELKENGNNVQVMMSVEGLKHPVGGWTSKSDAIYPLLVAAHEAKRDITYRIESQRKRKNSSGPIPRDVPIAVLRENMDIAKENCVNIFAGIDGTLSGEAVTNPAEDPAAGGRTRAVDMAPSDPTSAPAAAPAGGPGGFSAEQALTGLANARKGGLSQAIQDNAAALALAAGATVEQVLAAGVDPQADAPQRQVQRVLAKEAAPYVAYNTDGRVNLGSYMVQAAVGAESLAADLMHANAVEVAERLNAEIITLGEGEQVAPEPVNFKNAAALANVFLGLADLVQAGTSGGRPDRMATSHTRARGLVYDAVKNRHPVPFGQAGEVQEAWKQAVVEEATARFMWAVKIATEVRDAPAAPVAQAPSQQEAPATEAQNNAPAETPAAEQANTETEGAQVHQIGAAAVEKPKVLTEGDEGFEAPDSNVIGRFAALAQAAGFEGTPESPVRIYLDHKFGVTRAKQVHGENLNTLVTWYENQNEAGPGKFRAHVLAEAGDAATA